MKRCGLALISGIVLGIALGISASGCAQSRPKSPRESADARTPPGGGSLGCRGRLSLPLKTSAQSLSFVIGTAVRGDWLAQSADPKYPKVLAEQFGSLTPENEMKFSVLQPKQGRFDFKQADRVVQFAIDHGMSVHAPTLVWYDGLPPWLKKGRFGKKRLAKILEKHVTTVVDHFHKKFPSIRFEWDVVNEAIDPKTLQIRDHLWSKIGATPYDFIPLAFRWAHQADPTALLFYNDFQSEDLGSKSNAVFGLVSRMRQEDLPLDGVGFQFHYIRGETPKLEEIAENFRRYQQLGLQVRITELDYGLEPNETRDPDALERQAHAYATAFRACLESVNCMGVTTWGFTDRHSWLPNPEVPLTAPLLLDADYRAKPAFCAVSRTLLDFGRAHARSIDQEIKKSR